MSTNQTREQAKGWRFWLTRGTVLGLCGDLDAAEQNVVVLRQQLAQSEAKAELLTQALADLKAQHNTSRKGINVLLGFIHQAHRLGHGVTPGTIREALSK